MSGLERVLGTWDLEMDHVLVDEPVRGRVGQPSTPMRLNADAVLSFGVKIGRRSADLVLMDFVGTIRKQLHQTYAYPLPHDILDFVTRGIREMEGEMSSDERRSIVGIGMRSHSGVAAKLFEALSAGGINIQMISTSEIKTAVIIDEARIAEAANLTHEAFGLGIVA